MSVQSDIRTNITNQIISALQGNLPPWRKPWSNGHQSGFPTNVMSKRSYSGVNPMVLMVACQKMRLVSNWWGTFQQWSELGGSVKRRPDHIQSGQWGTKIVFCKPVKRTRFDTSGTEVDESYKLLRYFTVFNLDQVDGPFDHIRESEERHQTESEERYERAEQVIEATGADIRYGGDRACYCVSGDYIQMPHRDQFSSPEYYETLFHEMTHWSEHPLRLNWNRSEKENSYALGELIAEIGGCYLSAELGLPISDNLQNHAAYLKNWLSAMRNDSSFIFKAAAQASRACDFILSFSNQPAVLQTV